MTDSVTGIRRRRAVAGRRETPHLPPDRGFYGQTLLMLSGCCSHNPCSPIDVDIIRTEICADGFCRVTLEVLNTSSSSYYLLKNRGVYPELPVSVTNMTTGEEKTLKLMATNRPTDYDSYQLSEVPLGSRRQLSLGFYVDEHNPSDRLILTVRSIYQRHWSVSKEISRECPYDEMRSKGAWDFPSMSDAEIKKIKADLLLQKAKVSNL